MKVSMGTQLKSFFSYYFALILILHKFFWKITIIIITRLEKFTYYFFNHFFLSAFSSFRFNYNRFSFKLTFSLTRTHQMLDHMYNNLKAVTAPKSMLLPLPPYYWLYLLRHRELSRNERKQKITKRYV